MLIAACSENQNESQKVGGFGYTVGGMRGSFLAVTCREGLPKMHSCKVDAYKVHACKMHACKVHSSKMHARKLDAFRCPPLGACL